MDNTSDEEEDIDIFNKKEYLHGKSGEKVCFLFCLDTLICLVVIRSKKIIRWMFRKKLLFRGILLHGGIARLHQPLLLVTHAYYGIKETVIMSFEGFYA